MLSVEQPNVGRVRDAFRFTCNLSLAARLVCPSGLVNESLWHHPQIITLGDHNVGQLAALGCHSHLSTNVVLVSRVNKSARNTISVIRNS